MATGCSPATFAVRPHWPTNGTVAELRARLAERHPETSTAGWFTTVKDLWNKQVVPPKLQSAVMSILAAQPGVTVRGTTTTTTEHP